MKALFLNANLAGVGTYHRALWFARMLAEAGHEATVCTVSRQNKFTRRRYLDRKGVEIIEGPNFGLNFWPGRGSNFIDILERISYLQSGAYDVVYAFEYHPNVSWPVYLALKGRRLLSDWCDLYAGAANVFHGSKIMHRWDAVREAKIRLKADLVTVISDFLGKRAEGLGLPKEKIILIREGVDTNYMRPFEKNAVRAKLGLPQDALLLTTLQDGAAFPPLVECVSQLRKDFAKVALYFVGRPKPEQKLLAEKAGLKENETFYCTGFCSDEDLPRYLSAGDVAVLPMVDSLANRSRFPHKIGDYLACGLPVAVTDVGEYPALLKQEGLGVVAAPGVAFTEALLAYLKNSEKRAEDALRSRSWVKENLDWQVLKPTIVKCVEGN